MYALAIVGLTISGLTAVVPANGQAADWVWAGGSNQPRSGGVYGVQGKADPANSPGSRAYASSGTDASGNHWLFGGQGSDGTGAYAGELGDLWKFDPKTLEWTWVSGSSTGNQSGVYGSLNTAAAGNTPGARLGAASWVDANNNFWIFGGYGKDANGNSGELNDLWRFSFSTHLWAWVGGSNTVSNNSGFAGNYGTLGVSAVSNFPGSRQFANCWRDAKGNLWLFGGAGYDAQGLDGSLNDLWEYIPSSNRWIWMGGSSVANQPGVYGSKGVSGQGNAPGARNAASNWIDSQGRVWLFGGYGAISQGNYGVLGDLWKLDPTTHEWTWMSGDDSSAGGYQPGVYGKLGVAAAANTPGAREIAGSWMDGSGHLWLLGGYGFDSGSGQGPLDDLWKFDTALGEWTWVGGNSTISSSGGRPGIYGNEDVSSSTNTPGSRSAMSIWADANDAIWMFGGSGLGASGTAPSYLNDLWERGTPTSLPTFSLPQGTYTGKQTLNIVDATSNAKIYFTLDGTTPSRQSTLYAAPVVLTKTSQAVRAIALAPGHVGSGVALAQYTLNLPAASAPVFAPPGGTYTSAQSVTLVDATSGAAIYYTTNGTTPTTASAKYSSAIPVVSTETIKAVAIADGYASSPITTNAYTIDYPTTAIPSVSAPSGIYGTELPVALTDLTAGAVIYYTTNGTTPTTASTKYTVPLSLASSLTLKAIAVAPNYLPSGIVSATYTIAGSPIALNAPATAITSTGANLNALISPSGVAGSYFFAYGTGSTAADLTLLTPSTSFTATTARLPVTSPLTGKLRTKTQYYYQVVVTTVGGTSASAILSFITK